MLKRSHIVAGFLLVIGTAGITYGALSQLAPSLVHAQTNEQTSEGQSSGQEKVEKAAKRAKAATQQDTTVAVEASSRTQAQKRETPQDNEKTNETAKPSSPVEDEETAEMARTQDSTPSPTRKSQFQAHGCRTTGTSMLTHGDKQITWKEFAMQSRGSSGGCVTSIQKKLNTYCVQRLEVDGIFGPRTERAVQAYQSYMRSLDGLKVNGAKIYVDGIVGAQTFAVMQEFATSAAFLNCR